MRVVWVLLFSFFSLCVSPLCNAQVGELRAKSLADAAARRLLNFRESKPLRVHRREDLEDDLFNFQRKIRGKIAKAAYFYEITENGQFVISPDEAIEVISIDGEKKWLVAISATEGQSYALYGFKDAETAFNSLAKDAYLKLDSDTDAELYSYLYFRLVKDLFGNRLVFDSKHLRHDVRDYFLFHYPDAKAEALSHAWWKNYSSKKESVKLGANARKERDGYTVTLTTLDGLNNTPQLKLWEFRITLEGVLQEVNVQPIYPKL